MRIEAGEHLLENGTRLRLVAEGGEIRLELSLSPQDWVRQSEQRLWKASIPLHLPGEDLVDLASFRLTRGQQELALAPYRPNKRPSLQPQSFYVSNKALLVLLAQDEAPAEEAVVSFVLRRAPGVGGRVRGWRFSGRGLQLWPGQSLRVSVDVPQGAVLRFATTLDPLFATSGQQTVFRVLQDGEPIFERTENDHRRSSYAWHALELPRSGTRSELTFEVRGLLATTCFLAPTLGPGEAGAPGQRPWNEPRGDILVFLADTFRADNLTAYGASLGLTPNLDRLAQESLLFRRAWSVGTYTLPAHASLFTGLMPYQTGIREISHALPEELDTIVELLSAQGYRTGALTDSGIVSQRFGFDQGFEYFDEGPSALEDTVTRALSFLDADDGRPVFLFVHTYHTHSPYPVGAETRRDLGEALGLAGDYEETKRRLLDLARAHAGVEVPLQQLSPSFLRSAGAAQPIRELRASYLASVADLDRGLAPFLRALEERRWFEHGWLIFTSDHGEAFAEHGELFHSDTVFEEKIRIPLLIRGRGLAPGVIDHAASLLDLSPTLAGMAGLAPSTAWKGESLLTLRRDRPVYSFESDAQSTFAIIAGARKVIGFAGARTIDREKVLGAFDLADDPREERDAAAGGADWPIELVERFGPEVEHALVPLVEAPAARLGSADLEELRKLGYADD